MGQGEEREIFTAEGSKSVRWVDYAYSHAALPLLWLKAEMDLPVHSIKQDAVSYALDLSSMWKGVAYVNGFHIGRYWLVAGKCSGTCAPPVKNGHCYMHWKDCDKPTQTLYHIPTSILKPVGNQVVLFEESSPQQTRDPSSVRLVALTATAREALFV